MQDDVQRLLNYSSDALLVLERIYRGDKSEQESLELPADPTPKVLFNNDRLARMAGLIDRFITEPCFRVVDQGGHTENTTSDFLTLTELAQLSDFEQKSLLFEYSHEGRHHKIKVRHLEMMFRNRICSLLSF